MLNADIRQEFLMQLNEELFKAESTESIIHETIQIIKIYNLNYLLVNIE